jgi:ADP-sugar diphosphatase
MRGGAIGVLCILIDTKSEKQYALVTKQPRVPVGSASFTEIPAGMVYCNVILEIVF